MFTYSVTLTTVQLADQTTGGSGGAGEDDRAERGYSRSKTTSGLTPTTPEGSHMTASHGGRYDPSPVKRFIVSEYYLHSVKLTSCR